MIVYTHSFGRLGNQLWTHAHLLAFAIDRDLGFVSTTLRNQGPWYEGIPATSFLTNAQRRIRPYALTSQTLSLAHRLNLRIRAAPALTLVDGELLDLEGSPEMEDLVRTRPIVFASGLFFMASRALGAHADAVRALLTPIPAITADVDARMHAHRARHPHHVAVHLRRGDYRTFCDGDMFYSDEEYAVAMRAIANQLPGSTLFHLFSDEPVDSKSFAPLDVEVWNGSAAFDLHAMSACELIVGPNSSFSQWASFYGDRPIHVLNWRAEEKHGVGPAIREPEIGRDFKVFEPAGFGRFATHTVALETVLARAGRWL